MVERRTPFRVIAVALSAFVVLGIADSGLGVAWPSLREVLGRDLSDLGLLLAALSFGYLLASASFGRLDQALSLGRLMVIGALLLAISAIGLAVLSGWSVAFAAIAIMGMGAGLIDVGMNAHAALEFDRGSINHLHAAYGVGATTGPVLVATSLALGLEWRGGYAAVALIQIAVAFAIWRRRSSWSTPPRLADPLSDVGVGIGTTAGMLLVFLVYTGVEVATGQWAFSLLTLGRGMGAGAAGVWVALYWGGLTAGRITFGVVGERVSASRALGFSISVALAGLTILWWDPAGAGVVGLPLAGLGFAAVFPTMVALTPARIGRMRSTRMIGYQLAAANIGAASIPWAIGITAGLAGIGAIPAGLLVVTACLGALHLWLDRR